MKITASIVLSLLTVVPIFGLSGQGEAAELQSVTLDFEGRVGDQPFSCTESYRLGTAETRASPTDFRLYVSEVALINAAGEAVPVMLEQDGRWQYENVALLDFENRTGTCTNGTPETRTQVLGSVPTGEYEGVRFTVGLPFELNHRDATLASSPLNLTALWWNWRGGYKFLRADFQISTMGAERLSPGKGDGQVTHGTGDSHGDNAGHGTEATGFAIHLGSTGCQVEGNAVQPTSCLNPNQAEIVLEGFDPANQRVVIDLAALVQSNNLEVNVPNTPPGCMSAPEDGDCLGIMHNLGLPFNGEPSSGQTVFQIE